MIIFLAGLSSDSVGAEGLWHAALAQVDQDLAEQLDRASLIAGATTETPDSVKEFIE
jgi:hypothetical protein